MGLLVPVALFASIILLSPLLKLTTYTQTDPPAALDAPVLTAQVGAGLIELQWDAVTGAARYELQAWTEASGWFRTLDGAHIFCAIHSYFSTARKHRLNAIDAIYNAFLDQPFIPITNQAE